MTTSFLMSVGGAAGGGYSQVIPMEEVFFLFLSAAWLINKDV